MRRSFGRSSGRTTVVAAGAVTAVLLAVAPALADTTVVVRGTSFPAGRAAQLSLVGCQDPYVRAADHAQPYVGLGPQHAPAGRRSLGFDLDGGNAAGSVHYVDSVSATTVAGMSVFAPDGAAGVTYAGYQEPADAGTGLVWFGRAELSVPAGAWTRVDVAGLTFTWTKYDMLAQHAVGGPVGSAPVAAFVADHGGDGPGFFTIGFGCDGRPFSTDAWRIGSPGAVTTYDLEGLRTSTTITGSADRVQEGRPVTLTGTVTVEGGTLPSTRLVLEEQQADGDWAIVEGADGSPAELSVTPEQTTTYRWHLVDRPLAEGSVSAPFTVQVRPAAPVRRHR